MKEKTVIEIKKHRPGLWSMDEYENEKKWIILTKNYPVNDGHLVYEYDGILRIYIQDKNKNKIELKGKDKTLAKKALMKYY